MSELLPQITMKNIHRNRMFGGVVKAYGEKINAIDGITIAAGRQWRRMRTRRP